MGVKLGNGFEMSSPEMTSREMTSEEGKTVDNGKILSLF